METNLKNHPAFSEPATLITVRVPPAGGKTKLAKERPDHFVDSDAMLESFGYEASKQGVEKLREAGGLDLSKVKEYVGGRILLTNFDINWLNGTTDIPVFSIRYKPEDYIDHIVHSRRNDLLRNFSPDELESWMKFTADAVMDVGDYVSNYADEFIAALT